MYGETTRSLPLLKSGFGKGVGIPPYRATGLELRRDFTDVITTGG